MRTITLTAPDRQLSELLDAALSGPVAVLRPGEPGVVVLSAAEYHRGQSQAWRALLDTMAATGAHAQAQGLTEAELERLLELATLSQAIAAGRDSGPAQDAGSVFDRLEARYAAQTQE